jgi:hypothetical protein
MGQVSSLGNYIWSEKPVQYPEIDFQPDGELIGDNQDTKDAEDGVLHVTQIDTSENRDEKSQLDNTSVVDKVKVRTVHNLISLFATLEHVEPCSDMVCVTCNQPIKTKTYMYRLCCGHYTHHHAFECLGEKNIINWFIEKNGEQISGCPLASCRYWKK